MKAAVRLPVLVVVLSLAAVTVGGAQAPSPSPAAGPNPFSALVKASFDVVARYLVGSAEKMPEENYAFKPTPEVRSFAEILGHVANTHYNYCSRIKGEKNPNEGNDLEKKTAKADLVKALKDSIDYCSAVYADMTDAKALEPLPAAPAPAASPKPAGGPPAPPRFRLLLGNVTHDQEHYGNLVTYLRLKGLVPPSSEPRR
jgi:uncharacterized damage-inducible protein DinB